MGFDGNTAIELGYKNFESELIDNSSLKKRLKEFQLPRQGIPIIIYSTNNLSKIQEIKRDYHLFFPKVQLIPMMNSNLIDIMIKVVKETGPLIALFTEGELDIEENDKTSLVKILKEDIPNNFLSFYSGNQKELPNDHYDYFTMFGKYDNEIVLSHIDQKVRKRNNCYNLKYQ